MSAGNGAGIIKHRIMMWDDVEESLIQHACCDCGAVWKRNFLDAMHGRWFDPLAIETINLTRFIPQNDQARDCPLFQRIWGEYVLTETIRAGRKCGIYTTFNGWGHPMDLMDGMAG